MGKFDQSSRAAAKPRAAQNKNGGSTLLGVFIGLVIGVLLSLGVVWMLNKSPLPFQNKYEGAPRNGSGGTAEQTPAALPGKPGDKPAERQRFDFYNILEGKPAAAPAAPAAPGAAKPAASAAGSAVAPVAEAKPAPVEIFFLQVGSFQKAADADNLKAKLALTGLDASVQEVAIPEKGTMHRVRVGPYRDVDEMNRARALLTHSGLQGSVIKQKVE
ncbi:SPOR domain-containing protein [Sulfuritalea sp.]|uniref:SPOR domain-containing protein n=1 Tax=Sulfuritalea sp. TaxID=2480090 RepID=UPI00286E0ED6|nr:SPOR domain-containing protein [Sulfuritalea sp.]